MEKNDKGITRRDFLELVAVGAAGVAVSGMGISSVFASTPKRGGTLNAGVGFLIQTPDPQRYGGSWAQTHIAFIYEGLTTPTSIGERERIIKEKGIEALRDVQPMLAESWKIEKGGTRYVFHLKKGVKFHDGKEFDSGDVAWTWKRIQDPAIRAHARKFLTIYLESVETPDKYTVVANLSQPYGAFLMANSWSNTPILPKDCMPQGVIWGETPTFKPPTPGPAGTGPFKLVEFQQKSQAVLERHNDYRLSGLPYLDKVILKVISQPVPQTMAIRAGDIDYASVLDPNWVAKVMEGKEQYRTQKLEKDKLNIFTSGENPFTIYLNSHPEKGNSPFKDVRVRQAMDLSLDRAKISQVLWGQMGVPVGQGFDPNVSPWGFDDIGYTEQNISKAKELLQEAGYPDGLDINFSITPTWGKQDLLAQIVQQMAAPAGFRVKIISEVGTQYWGRLRTMNYHMLHFHLGKDDPMQFYYEYLHTDPAAPYNGFSPALGVRDPEMDELLDQMAAENDFAKRKEIFKKVTLRSQEKAYWLPYVSTISSRVWSSKLKNVKMLDYPQMDQSLREAWLDI